MCPVRCVTYVSGRSPSIYETYRRDGFRGLFWKRLFCCPLAVLLIDVLAETTRGFAEVSLRGDVVPIENRFRLMAGNFHRDAAVHTGSNQISHASSSEVVRNQSDVFFDSLPAR
jgi:hypothetical protein